jgi:hypothetical protein
LNPFPAGFHQSFQAVAPLLFAGCFFGCGITTKAEGFLVHHQINVLGKTPDQPPGF